MTHRDQAGKDMWRKDKDKSVSLSNLTWPGDTPVLNTKQTALKSVRSELKV